ncbi:unnamed protein product [Brassica oleracea]
MGSVRDGPKKTAVNPNVPQLLLSSLDRPPEKKRESESESGLRGNITRSLQRNSPLKKKIISSGHGFFIDGAPALSCGIGFITRKTRVR